MAQATKQATRTRSGSRIPGLERLIEFADPRRDDVALDVSHGPSPLPGALRPLVAHIAACDSAVLPVAPPTDRRTPTLLFGRQSVTAVRADATALPYGDSRFTLVTSRSSLYRASDTGRALREMIRVCRPGGRIIIADLIRRGSSYHDRIETLRDPQHPQTPSIARLIDLVTAAGADVRRLDVFTLERPLAPWLGPAARTPVGRHIQDLLMDEVDGGPLTGARPRVIGGELWFTQSWIHLAAQPL